VATTKAVQWWIQYIILEKECCLVFVYKFAAHDNGRPCSFGKSTVRLIFYAFPCAAAYPLPIALMRLYNTLEHD